jgi:hypothetical protein
MQDVYSLTLGNNALSYIDSLKPELDLTEKGLIGWNTGYREAMSPEEVNHILFQSK